MAKRSEVQRETEGARPGPIGRGQKHLRGRPAGSKNKPKSLVPTELANEILLRMEGTVPDEHYRYLKGVIKDGKTISTKQELDVLILLLNRNLWPALVSESTLLEDKETGKKEPAFRKDVTERLKVLNSLLSLRATIEKGEKKDDDDGEQPLVRIFADRSIAGRIGVLVGVQPGGVLGDSDGTGRESVRVGAVPDQVPERPLALPSGQQE